MLMTTKFTVAFLALILGLFISSESALAAEKSSDEVAKELSNPAGSLASLSLNIQYTAYEGDLHNSRDQGSTPIIF
jgi:hypothetical protein